MSFLSKLTTHVAAAGQSPIQTLAVGRTPAAIPEIEIDLRQSFRSPQTFTSTLSSGSTGAAATMSVQSLSEAAPLPEIEVSIPRDKPAPPHPTTDRRA